MQINLKNPFHFNVTHMPMKEFDSTSFEISSSLEEEPQKNLWICGASKASMVTNGSKWYKDAMYNAYVSIPYQEEEFEPMEWMHCLATLDICIINHGINFVTKKVTTSFLFKW